MKKSQGCAASRRRWRLTSTKRSRCCESFVHLLPKNLVESCERRNVLTEHSEFIWRPLGSYEALAAETNEEGQVAETHTLGPLVTTEAGELLNRPLKVRKFSHNRSTEAIA